MQPSGSFGNRWVALLRPVAILYYLAAHVSIRGMTGLPVSFE